jgi:4'-phosphopantetheinyl transferase
VSGAAARAVRVLRLVPETAAPAAVEAARALLDPAERARADAFARPLDRARFTVVRAALRRAVGAATGVAPAQVRLLPGPHGKPEATGVHVNVSHTDGLALVALSPAAPVGVDVERRAPSPRDADLADRYFSPAEAARVRAAPDPGAAFLRLWVRKEAALKATGRGLGGGLEVEVGDGSAGGWAVLPGLWLTDLEVGPGHLAALAVARGDRDDGPPKVRLLDGQVTDAGSTA